MCKCDVDARIVGSSTETDDKGRIVDVLLFECPKCKDRYFKRVVREPVENKKNTKKKKGA